MPSRKSDPVARAAVIDLAVAICAKLEASDPALAREFIRRYQGATGFRTDVATTVRER